MAELVITEQSYPAGAPPVLLRVDCAPAVVHMTSQLFTRLPEVPHTDEEYDALVGGAVTWDGLVLAVGSTGHGLGRVHYRYVGEQHTPWGVEHVFERTDPGVDLSTRT